MRGLAAALAAAGLPEAEADARVLLEEATGLRRAALLTGGEAPLGLKAAARLAAWLPRRLAREPVFRILGIREFWGLPLRVTPDVLDPRPDTETVVDAARRAWAARAGAPRNVLDLGTGSGALLCAALTLWPQARGIGLDRSPGACAVARLNIEACGLDARAAVREGDWSAAAGRFDCILSNPPYIPTAEIAGLAPEVRDFDPALALDGGADGLAAYRAIAGVLPGLLAPRGLVFLEVGAGQASAVTTLLMGAGLAPHGTARDLAGHDRVVMAGSS